MNKRRGEKIGWTGGWLGAFLWVAILAVVFLFRGQELKGVSGLVLAGIAVSCILYFAPWRFPNTPYWKLFLVPYGMLFLVVVWAIWCYGGVSSLDLTGWEALWLLPALIPLGALSQRRWTDGEAKPVAPEADRPNS